MEGGTAAGLKKQPVKQQEKHSFCHLMFWHPGVWLAGEDLPLLSMICSSHTHLLFAQEPEEQGVLALVERVPFLPGSWKLLGMVVSHAV